MVLPNERSKEIGNAFHKYVETSDKALIEQYKRDEIELALVQYYRDKGWPHYNAMEKRVAELQTLESDKSARKDKLKDRIITFILGLVSGIILLWIGYNFFTS